MVWSGPTDSVGHCYYIMTSNSHISGWEKKIIHSSLLNLYGEHSLVICGCNIKLQCNNVMV